MSSQLLPRTISRPPRRPRSALLQALVLLVAAVVWTASASQRRLELGEPEIVAEGIRLFRIGDSNLLDPPGPVAIQMLRLDPHQVELRSAGAKAQGWGRETVQRIAEQHKAIAAINAGFFEPSGEPAGLLKMAGQVLSIDPRQRGAVGIAGAASPGAIRLLFDRVTVRASVEFSVEGTEQIAAIAGVDTTRLRGRLMLYTPRYGPHTDTAPAGTEWVLSGMPLRVAERRSGRGKSRIPADGAVLSFGGTVPPPPLDRLAPGREVRVGYDYRTVFGTSPAEWASVSDITGGAGLLFVRNQLVDEWAAERFTAPGFTTDRHPRTMIGVGPDEEICMVTVDGRQPGLSLGMTFGELQHLARALELRDALNLDGGGSTTMVVRNRIVNHPSDPTGPRMVSDALLVFPRGAPESR